MTQSNDMNTETVSGYNEVTVWERVKELRERASSRGFNSYAHTSHLSNGGLEVTIQFSKRG